MRKEYNVVTGETLELPDFPEEIVETPIPSSLTMMQARLVIYKAGLLPAVAAFIEALPEPTKTEVSLVWEYAASVEREHPLVQLLAKEFKLTEEALDQLFLEGSKL